MIEETYKKYLDFCARLPRYSVNNQLLIMMQKPDATLCQSFTEWKDKNRFVKKGEKGIRILAPSPYKVEREQEKKDEAGNPVTEGISGYHSENSVRHDHKDRRKTAGAGSRKAGTEKHGPVHGGSR